MTKGEDNKQASGEQTKKSDSVSMQLSNEQLSEDMKFMQDEVIRIHNAAAAVAAAAAEAASGERGQPVTEEPVDLENDAEENVAEENVVGENEVDEFAQFMMPASEGGSRTTDLLLQDFMRFSKNSMPSSLYETLQDSMLTDLGEISQSTRDQAAFVANGINAIIEDMAAAKLNSDLADFLKGTNGQGKKPDEATPDSDKVESDANKVAPDNDKAESDANKVAPDNDKAESDVNKAAPDNDKADDEEKPKFV